MIQDPHNWKYGVMNLHPEHFEEMKKNEKLLHLANSVRGIFEDGLVAAIRNSRLDEIAFEATWELDLHTKLVNINWYSGHDAALTLCILTHGAMEHFDADKETAKFFESDGITRFWKSPHDNEAYLPENVVRKLMPGHIGWYYSELKRKPKPIPVVEAPQQFSLFG